MNVLNDHSHALDVTPMKTIKKSGVFQRATAKMLEGAIVLIGAYFMFALVTRFLT